MYNPNSSQNQIKPKTQLYKNNFNNSNTSFVPNLSASYYKQAALKFDNEGKVISIFENKFEFIKSVTSIYIQGECTPGNWNAMTKPSQNFTQASFNWALYKFEEDYPTDIISYFDAPTVNQIDYTINRETDQVLDMFNKMSLDQVTKTNSSNPLLIIDGEVKDIINYNPKNIILFGTGSVYANVFNDLNRPVTTFKTDKFDAKIKNVDYQLGKTEKIILLVKSNTDLYDINLNFTVKFKVQ